LESTNGIEMKLGLYIDGSVNVSLYITEISPINLFS